jgi:outer membrane protein assembly factor BamE (lipoprotein component of BamABCDE complex)
MRYSRNIKLIVFGLLVMVLFAGGLWYFLRGHQSKVTKENWDRIEIGMTRDEVTAILGQPNTGPYRGLVKEGSEVWDTSDEDGPMIELEFDAEERVTNRIWYYPSNVTKQSITDRVINWFK